MNPQPKAPTPQTAAPSDPVADESPSNQRARGSAASQTSQTRQLTFLRAIINNLGEGAYALDSHGRVTFMNPAAERMLGWTEDELRGREMHPTIHFQHADGTPYPKEECPLLHVLRSGGVTTVDDDTFTRKDGSMFSVAYVSSPIVIDGEIIGAVLAFHDISTQKTLNEALRRSEREAAARASQLVAIFESIADAVLVYDRDGRILQTNGAASLLLEAQMPPGIVADTLDERNRYVTYLNESGQSLADEQRPAKRILGGEVMRGANAIDLTVRSHEGQEVIMNVSGAPIRDTDGTVVGGVLIGRDVTERRWQERQTREALNALMAMAEALVASGQDDVEGMSSDSPVSPNSVAKQLAVLTQTVMGCERVAIVATEPETGEMHVAAIASFSAEEERIWQANWPRAGRMSDFLTPALIERLKAGEIIAIDRTQPPFNRWPNPFGSRTLVVIPLRVGGRHLGEMSLDYGATTRQPTTDEFAMAGAVAKLAAQIIERERLARDREIARANALALAETARRMDEFLSVAAHELKTPVTNGMLTTTLALDTLRAFIAQAGQIDEATRDALAYIQRLLERSEAHTYRLSRLIVDLLDVSRIRAGKLQLRMAPCNLAAIVRDVVEEQRQIALGRAILLQLPRASRLTPIVLADSDRIRQVVANYLTNALKYSRGDLPVHVRLLMKDGWARVSVRDEGPGVPSAEQRRVWERFYRAPGTQVLSGSGIGLGLGLHISRTLIEQHQGRVGLRNARGGGAIFWFALQLAPDES
jgi:PAS domain S-box-containing protein